MIFIGGNLTAKLMRKSSENINEIGENIVTWEVVDVLKGWLDLSSGNSERSSTRSKIQNSTHIFICDYKYIDNNVKDKRLIINNLEYDILLIDNPMELNQHLEIYLKFLGS